MILLKEALLHLPLAEVFYSDLGVVPHTALNGQMRLSLMDLLPATWMAALLFVVWGIVAVLLLFGVCTRAMTILNFILIISVQARNPFILSGADTLLRLLSFWMLFIPLDRDFTWRALYRKQSNAPEPLHTVNALPVRILQGQVALAYLMTGLFKLMGQSWRSGDAVFQVLQLGSMLRPFGHWLAASAPDSLLRLLTYGVICTELAFPILMFIPVGQPHIRRFGLVLALLLHMGIAFAMTTLLFDFLLVFGVSYLPFFARTVCKAEEAQPTSKQMIMPVALLLVLLVVIWQNADDLRQSGFAGIPTLTLPISTLLAMTGLQQHWQLFAPIPLAVDWSVNSIGTFESGVQLDLWTGNSPINEIVPAPNNVIDYRWTAFDLWVIQNHPDVVLDAWSRYICRQFNAKTGSPRLVTLELRALTRHWHTAGANVQPLRNDLLWLHRCTD